MKMISDLQDIMAAPSRDVLWDIHQRSMARFGFGRLIYGFTRFRNERALGDLNDMLLLSNFEDAYLEGFIDGGLYRRSPMLQWAVDNDGSCSWGIMERWKGSMSKETWEVIEFNKKMGATSGYTVSLREVSSRHRGAVGLCADPGVSQMDVDALWEDHGAEIELLNQAMHLKMVNLPDERTDRQLTDRQREVLEWVGDGKTTQDIALIMGLTPATVEKHLRLARQTLDVDTTAHALLRASFHNQIYVLRA